MHINELPIGVFDSGLGGLTAVREIKKILPGEDILYFGDTARLPYGTRSPEIIQKYACDDMNFLLTHSVKAILVACGTVSSTAINLLHKNFDTPIFGVVEPASERACAVSQSGRIAVLATPSTIRTGAFDREIEKTRGKITEFQNKLKELEAQRTEQENFEIVNLVRSMCMTRDELMNFLRGGGNDAPPVETAYHEQAETDYDGQEVNEDEE